MALGFLWLVDAALQYQPYMFTKAFVTDTLEPTAAGNPLVVAHPINWAANVMVHHIVVYNAVFATIQLTIAVGLLLRRMVRAALAVSIAWSLAVWWLGEGLGGVLTGATNPFVGAPGAVILYAFLALLAWPRPGDDPSLADPALAGRARGDLHGRSVATTSILGAQVARLATLTLWGSFVYFTLQPVNRNNTSLGDMVTTMVGGEPAWVRSMDHHLGDALTGHGTVVAYLFVGLFAFAGLGCFVPRLVRGAVVVGVVVGVAIWILEDFGGIFTGKGTDPNSGLLVALVAATFWPIRRSRSLGAASESVPDPAGG